jgi:rhodanese-related sulfurtransferase
MSTPQTGFVSGPYAGDLTPVQAWDRLAADDAAILVDVRTRIELALTGGPDLAALAKEPVFAEWVTQQGRNPVFMPELKKALAERGAGPDTPILFLCRTAGRSRMAAGELTSEGFRACYNIAEGFEGDLDAHGHRNSVNGWKARGLPWKQT